MSKATFEITTRGGAKVLNLLAARKIDVFNVKQPDAKTLIFSVNAVDERLVVDFLTEKCYNIKTMRSALTPKAFLKANVLLIALVIFAFSALNIISSMLLKVDVSCESDFDTQSVARYLSDNGVKRGVFKSRIDLDTVENMVCTAFPELVYARAEIKGGVFTLILTKKHATEKVLDLKTPKDIVASFDGVVTRVYVVSGTAKVKAGDKVVKGQVLIEGKRTFYDETTEDVCAVGEVFGNAEYKGEAFFALYQTVFKETGKTFVSRKMSFFAIDLKSRKQNPFATFSVKTKESSLFPFPFLVTKYTYTETAGERVKKDFETEKEGIMEEARKRALAQINDDIPTETEYSFVTSGEGDVLVTAKVMCLKKMSEYKA